MLIKKPADIPYSEVTDRKLYVDRRDFIRAAAGVAAAGALSGVAWRCVPMDLPEPMRLAASASMATVVRPRLKTTAMRVSRRFMTIPFKKTKNSDEGR